MLMMYLTLSKLVNKGGADGGLSGRSSSGDPDHERRSHGRRPIPHPRVVARHAGAVLCHLGQIFLKYINVNRDQIFYWLCILGKMHLSKHVFFLCQNFVQSTINPAQSGPVWDRIFLAGIS